jgi:bacterioferritin-associated ferredoxin
VGATAVGEWRDWERVEDAVHRKRPVSHWRIERFTRGESLWPDEPSATGRPDEQLICTCNRVDYGTICGAVRGGCKTVAELAARTGATRTCGSCVPVIERILKLDAPPLQAPRRGAVLLSLGVVALLATALLIGARPLLQRWLPQHLPFWDQLWREPVAQQVTGFSTVGLLALALVLPLRRKLPKLPASVSLWRVVHGAVGGLAVAALAAHTGLRLGVNLNLFLSIGFLALAAVGGLTAFWPWGQRPPGGLARALRFVHLTLFWPALALVALHVLAVYSF